MVRSAGTTFLAQHPTSGEQRKALRDIASCRTATLGGHVLACQQCDHQEISYNSCRNRHCPKCQGSCQAKWLQDRAADLLPVPYFHVVFTLPALLGPIALQNPRQIYGILFRAVSQTLLTIARDQRHLGAKIGFLAILHTWGQNLMHHPHLHCVVPGGGLGADESSWVSCHHSFFLPVRVLSRVFRGKFLHSLDRHYHTGELSFHGQLQSLACPEHWKTLLRQLRATDWVVYSKPPFGGPEQVLKYLARYTHRVAISNRRLLSFQQGQVSLRCKDYRRGGPLQNPGTAAAGVYSPFPTSCPADPLCAHPQLRLSGQPLPPTKAGTLPAPARSYPHPPSAARDQPFLCRHSSPRTAPSAVSRLRPRPNAQGRHSPPYTVSNRGKDPLPVKLSQPLFPRILGLPSLPLCCSAAFLLPRLLYRSPALCRSPFHPPTCSSGAFPPQSGRNIPFPHSPLASLIRSHLKQSP